MCWHCQSHFELGLFGMRSETWTVFAGTVCVCVCVKLYTYTQFSYKHTFVFVVGGGFSAAFVRISDNSIAVFSWSLLTTKHKTGSTYLISLTVRKHSHVTKLTVWYTFMWYSSITILQRSISSILDLYSRQKYPPH